MFHLYKITESQGWNRPTRSSIFGRAVLFILLKMRVASSVVYITVSVCIFGLLSNVLC